MYTYNAASKLLLTDVAATELRRSSNFVSKELPSTIDALDTISDQSILVNTPRTPAAAKPQKQRRISSRY